MNTSVLLLAVVIWLTCVFAALAFFISRVNSVRKDTEKAINLADELTNKRIDSFADFYNDSLLNLSKRVEKLEESKICILETGTDEVRNTALYAITKVGYSTVIVSLTEDELAVIDSFIDWADLEEDFSAVKLDKHYTAENWRNKK